MTEPTSRPRAYELSEDSIAVCNGAVLLDPRNGKPVKGRNGVLRYALRIAYDGAAFFGWQKQKTSDGRPLRSVQETVTDAIKLRIPDQRIHLVGASRTDRGVHALGQVAQFDAASPIPAHRLARALNDRLPYDIEVRGAAVVPWSFNSIQSVASKQYRFTFHTSDQRPLGDRHQVCWVEWPTLDVDAINAAGARLLGTHDVAGLASSRHGREDTTRTIHRVEAIRESDTRLHLYVEGSGFLYNQVRIMAGTLIEVARGAFPVGRIDEILATGNRALAGPTLGPEGLTLMWIRYDGYGLS